LQQKRNFNKALDDLDRQEAQQSGVPGVTVAQPTAPTAPGAPTNSTVPAPVEMPPEAAPGLPPTSTGMSTGGGSAAPPAAASVPGIGVTQPTASPAPQSGFPMPAPPTLNPQLVLDQLQRRARMGLMTD
jgi:hypothetical protein